MASASRSVQTVLGRVPVAELGVTLMHEHLFIAFDGVQFDPTATMDRGQVIEECVKRLRALKEAGVDTFVDPCPIELGRDVTLMAEVSERSGVHVICATGFYYEQMGLPPYWRMRTVEEIAALLIGEIERGIGNSRIRAGIIKCATGMPEITPQEKKFLAAASIAHHATGVPILTHIQMGLLGPEQQEEFARHGVPMHRCLIGHCCNNPDPDYHRRIVERGTYIGFDRVGNEHYHPDTLRADNVVKLKAAGFLAQLMLSQDRFCVWQGSHYLQLPAAEEAQRLRMLSEGQWPPHHTHIITHFLPMLRERGVTDGEVHLLMTENPRRFFEGGALPAPAPLAAR